MFKHIKHEIIRPFAKAEHTEDGHFYRTNEGKLYPSVTTVFKALDTKEWYPYWVASVARKEGITEAEAEIRCKEIGNNSMEMGNGIHDLAEDYVNGKPMKKQQIIEEINPYDLFVPLAEHLDEHVDNIHGAEKKIYSDEMGLAGTADLIAEYDGVLSVIDFKNSRKPKSKSECQKKNYFEQICAYAKMWEYCTDQKIEQGVILVVSWDGKVKPFKVNIDDHEEALWDILVRYEQHKALNTT
jgi:genome maintenance exonuclease 1